MIVTSLQLADFRNYDFLDIHFDENTNILYGNNAQGKTNILEALYICVTTKSHRGGKDKEMIRFGKEEAHIKVMLEKKGIPRKIDIHLKNHKSKGIAIDGIPIKKSSELLGLLNIVFFSPEDLSIIKNGPAERRKFMDVELCQLNNIYFHHFSQYQKVLNQRNNLLKQLIKEPYLMDTLEIWDKQLIEHGSIIIEEREKFIIRLNAIIKEIHNKLTGNKEEIQILYEKNTKKEQFLENLNHKKSSDLKSLTTQTGPHRDDMAFMVNGIDIRKFGSQGQQRTVALSLKLAEIQLVKSIIKDTPILLLDDVMSELDHDRKNYLLESIKDIQTIITCTGLDEFIKGRLNIDKIFQVTEGTVTEKILT
ncbi:MAG: DNA replication/repair protein RecF [Lachnospiraceae bacterium]|nr:DNA replication/repair protein RecF [Lachnospiraceae bacterium]